MDRLTLKHHYSQSKLYCYRLNYRSDYDEELVWKLIQKHGGIIKTYPDHIDFWIEPAWEETLVTLFPDLDRMPSLDYS